MPLFFVILGLVLIDSGVRGNAAQLFQQVTDDAKGFIAFAAVIIILWGAGISQSVRPISKMMLVLVFVVYSVKNGASIITGIEAVSSAKTNNLSSPQGTTGGSNIASTTGSSAGPTTANVLGQYASAIEGLGTVNAGAQQDLASGASDLSQGYDQGVINMVQHAPQKSGGNSSQQALQTGLAVAGIIAMML